MSKHRFQLLWWNWSMGCSLLVFLTASRSWLTWTWFFFFLQGRSLNSPWKVGRQNIVLSTCFLLKVTEILYFSLYKDLKAFCIGNTVTSNSRHNWALCGIIPTTLQITSNTFRMRCWTCRAIHLHVRWLDVVQKILRTACSIHDENQMEVWHFRETLLWKLQH